MTEEDFMSIGEPVIEESETDATETIEQPIEATEQSTETNEEAETETEETQPTAAKETENAKPERAVEETPLAPQINPEEARRRVEEFRTRMLAEQELRGVLGKINPYTNTPIQTMEDYEAYKEAHRIAEQRTNTANLFNRIQNGTAAPDEFENFVQGIVKQALNNSPDLLRARQAADKAEQAERQARLESGRNRLQADIDALNKEYPNCGISKPEDITDDAMLGYIRKGLNVSDAYYLTHRKEIAEKQQAAAKQAVINQAQGKAHLKTTTGGASEETSVSEEMINSFKQFYPNASREELIKMCKRYM